MKFLKYAPALTWMIVIFYFSSRSTVGIGTNETDRFLILKSFHLIEYATLSILIFYAIRNYKYTIITAYLYAITDEIHQYFVPGRTCKITDTFIDLIGISIGLLLLKKLLSYYQNRQNKLH